MEQYINTHDIKFQQQELLQQGLHGTQQLVGQQTGLVDVDVFTVVR